MKNKKAIVLLSGGLDSAVTLFWAKSKTYKCHNLIFDYGQRHKKEIESAKKIAREAGCEYKILKISLPWKGSSLLDNKLSLPKFISKRKGIPSTYVPARNLIFLSFAVSFAESIGAQDIFIGANAIDFSGYPDCRPEFYRSLKKTIKSGTKSGARGREIRIRAPLINKTKKEIIELGAKLRVPYKYTWSCYRGTRLPCGACDSCKLRQKGFAQAEINDPALN